MILFNGFNYKKIHRKLYHLGLQKQKKLKKKKKPMDSQTSMRRKEAVRITEP
jgi:hypothetical protein